jgi:hypothetical protein
MVWWRAPPGVAGPYPNNNGTHGLQSNTAYNHFALLKSLEGGFGLACLNHACDTNVNVITDLFGSVYQ